jgi:hypothetical protein
MKKLLTLLTLAMFLGGAAFAQTKVQTKTSTKNGSTTTTTITKKHKKRRMAGHTITKDTKKVETTKTPVTK